MDKEKQIRELRDYVMRAQVILRELIAANDPEDVARELAIYDEGERVLNE